MTPLKKIECAATNEYDMQSSQLLMALQRLGVLLETSAASHGHLQIYLV